MKTESIRSRLQEKGLKVTPQRMAILEAMLELDNHPDAEHVLTHIRKKHPNISIATVYKVLEVFTECGLIRKVKTEKDAMRYDAILESHHHIYCSDSDKIEDYFDQELNANLERYFNEKKIPGFQIEDIKIQIIGKYTKDVK